MKPTHQKDLLKRGKCNKGRSKELMKLRNIKIVKMFFKHSEVDRLRLDDTLRKIMSRFKSSFYVNVQFGDIIRANTHLLDALAKGESIDEMKILDLIKIN